MVLKKICSQKNYLQNMEMIPTSHPNSFSPTPPSSSRSKSRSNRFTSDTVALLSSGERVFRDPWEWRARCPVQYLLEEKIIRTVVTFVFLVFICFAKSTSVMHDDKGLRHMRTKMISKFEKTKDQS